MMFFMTNCLLFDGWFFIFNFTDVFLIDRELKEPEGRTVGFVSTLWAAGLVYIKDTLIKRLVLDLLPVAEVHAAVMIPRCPTAV